jgi:4-diphosphocytidyl-2C-methyl-D-erythritol kinase
LNKKDYTQEGYEEFKAPAKINLFLKIIGKRDDGFHNYKVFFNL